MTARLLLLLFFFPFAAMAEEGASPWFSADEVKVRLVSASTTVGSRTDLKLGLEVRLKEGWKTYWRTPGSAGLPTEIDWAGSTNLASAKLEWPTPHRFTLNELDSFGYAERVILPITVILESPSKPLSLNANVSLMVCEDLCIPYEIPLQLTLPTGRPASTYYESDIRRWEKLVPRPTNLISSATLTGTTLSLQLTEPMTATDVFVETTPAYTFKAPAFGDQTITVTTDTEQPIIEEATITLATETGGTTQTISVTTLTPPLNWSALALAILTALIGGLILNLMPCVLPVLALKMFSIVSHAGAPPRHVRLAFLASAAGMIFSFLVLAAGVIALKSAGHAVGWGMQFQEPGFLIFMIILLALFAAALWELVHIPLPRFIADAVNDRLPQGQGHDRTLVGNFLTGAFATLLATPCSAPFVGTAIGFALAGNNAITIVIFFALGLGLALPFLLVAAFPQLARYIPKPGKWMSWLRALMGFALLATALWLLMVLQTEWGPGKASNFGGAIIFILFVLWIRAAISRPRLLLTGGLGILLFITAAVTVPPLFAGPKRIDWQPFDQARIAEEVAKGRVVLVDVTADWCLTCKVNERLVLNDPTLAAFLNENTLPMRADWTRPDAAISSYIKSFGRHGIPFNVIYGPATPKGLVLPELLTDNAVREAIKEAQNDQSR